MDIDNPNRDLSDPNWISAGAAHAQNKALRDRVVAQREPEIHPDLLVYWDPKLDYGIEYNVEVFRHKERCESCLATGCYVLRDDPNSIGLCRSHLEADKKQIIKIVELPKIHNY